MEAKDYTLTKDQLVMLYENINEDEGKTTTSWQWGACQDDSFDGLILIAKQKGGLFALEIPYEGYIVKPVTINGKPAIAKKDLFGKYKFPKARV
jgi:hypothetical protein